MADIVTEILAKRADLREAEGPIYDGAKHDDGKLRLTRVPTGIIREIAKVREYAHRKYKTADEWHRVDPQRFRDAAYRHWLAYLDGSKVDDESGLPHLSHLATNIAFLIEMEMRADG